MKNEVLIFQKKIEDEIYYVAEVRTGRKKLVSATMYKHKAKKEGDHTNRKSLKGLPFTSDNALVPSPDSEQSENFSENQEENAKYSNYVYSKRIDFKKFSNSFSSSLTV